MMAATVLQQLCKSCRTCFKSYCMFYFTYDRSFTTLQSLQDSRPCVTISPFVSGSRGASSTQRQRSMKAGVQCENTRNSLRSSVVHNPGLILTRYNLLGSNQRELNSASKKHKLYLQQLKAQFMLFLKQNSILSGCCIISCNESVSVLDYGQRWIVGRSLRVFSHCMQSIILSQTFVASTRVFATH